MEKTKGRSPPMLGDHIFIQRSICYRHHGIYIGNDKVIHYQTPMEKCHPDPKACRVVETDMSTFIGEEEHWYLFRYGVKDEHAKLYPKGTYTSKQCDEHKLVVKRARQALKDGFSHYNIVGNNCEDFANYCKTGQRSMESTQFSEALERVAVARHAFANGYRSPLVYAGCVMGLFASKDFNDPPSSHVPDSPIESDEDSSNGKDVEEGQSKEMGKTCEGKEDKTKAKDTLDMVTNNTCTTSCINTHYKQDDSNNSNQTSSRENSNVTPSNANPLNHYTGQYNHGNTLATKGNDGIGDSQKKVSFNIPEVHDKL